MKKFYHKIGILALSFTVFSCSNPEESEAERLRRQNQKGEYIYRMHDEFRFIASSPMLKPKELYPWEIGTSSKYPKITKEFFRCKGSILNAPRIHQKKGEEPTRYHDCGGAERHSLPLRNGKEFIYPILIDLLNYVQTKTGKRVVITSGHRCPEHNVYTDPSSENQYSKHMIGAEVAFYVQGMENQPEEVLKYIFDYYKEIPKYKGLKEYQVFNRYTKNDIALSTIPWCNKEVFIKLFKKKEGRDFDNRHPYPYLSIQVRYDWELQEKVSYSWEKAQRNYLRW